MKLLLDTHILMWTLTDDPRLSASARTLIEHADSEIYYSVISVWETDIKHHLHPDVLSINGEQLAAYCHEAGFHSLSLTVRHISPLHTLTRKPDAPAHRDPFDRIMICQALSEGMFFLTHDSLLPFYNEPCIIPV